MAFEAVLSHARGAERKRPRLRRRLTLTASLAVHVAALVVGIAYSLWQVDELPLPAVTITLASSAPPPPPPPPPARRKASTSRPKVKPTQPKPDTLTQPREQPKEQPKPQDDEPEEDGAQEGGVEGGVKGGVQGGVVGGVVGAPQVQNKGPRLVTPQVAKGLLLIDPSDERYRVKLPPALERAGATASVHLYICVSAQGTVASVRILRGAGPAIDGQIPSVIGRWRYRPLLIDGQPTPFCYQVLYEISSH